jgi:transposase
MIGVQQPAQSSLFYVGLNIEKRIRSNHPLRKVNELIDFYFAYNEVKDLYAAKATYRSLPDHLEIDAALGWQCSRSSRFHI